MKQLDVITADYQARLEALQCEVEELREQLDLKADDRFRGRDFRAFLEVNPALNPPPEE